LSSSGCLRFSQPLWALKGVFELTLVAFIGGLTLSLCRLTATLPTLSRGPENPLYPTSRLGSTAGRYPHSLGLCSPYHLPCSMHEAPGKGGRSQPAVNLRTLCAHLGLAHHHPTPQRLAVLTLSFLPGAQPKRMPTLFTPTILSQAIAHTVVYPSIPLPIQHISISSLSLTFL
jgi:hypothetical protein